MIKKILIVVMLALAGLLGYAATRPDRFAVERSLTIAAPPEKIAAQIEDFHRWAAWSPYEKLDPGMQREYGAIERGVGASYAWRGDGKVGAGRMTITEVRPDRVLIDLEFIEPFATRNIATFSLQPGTAGTQLTWRMEGPSPYINKLMGVLFDMDAMIGKDFEAGLAALKTVAER